MTRDGDRILIDGVEVERSTGPIHGIAMDLGTTTVVVRLLDLESGELIADTSFENPQRFGGSEIMSRIAYDTSHPGRLLMRTLAGYLSHAIEKFPVDPKTIYEMVVVGNSTMRDLFFRQNVYSIGQTPYRSITEIEMAEGKRTTTSLVESGLRSLLPIHPKARVYGAPIISGHVGADAAACMLAVDLAHEERLDRDHGHRHEHRVDCRKQGIGFSRHRARRGRPLKAAPLLAACPLWTARSKKWRLTRTANSGFASSATCRRKESAARGWSTC